MATALQIVGLIMLALIVAYYLGDRIWIIGAIIVALFLLRWIADMYWAYRERGW